jgi:solute carrier family 35 (UDP-sugar transporter), member A1/2/3
VTHGTYCLDVSNMKFENFCTMKRAEAKWTSLILFIIQNSALIISLRCCSFFSDSKVSYISSTAVLFSEILKLAISLALCLAVDSNWDVHKFSQILYRGFVEENRDCMKLSIPAMLYTIQNNLQYVIETAPLFQMLYHCKLITTAVFYTTLLSQKLSAREWLTILALVIGVSMVQLSQADIQSHHNSYSVGIESVILACMTSGFAGVSYEKTLKASKSSIWIINIQLSLMCSVLALGACWFTDFNEIRDGGFMQGYNSYVLIVIALQSITGLVRSISFTVLT